MIELRATPCAAVRNTLRVVATKIATGELPSNLTEDQIVEYLKQGVSEDVCGVSGSSDSSVDRGNSAVNVFTESNLDAWANKQWKHKMIS